MTEKETITKRKSSTSNQFKGGGKKVDLVSCPECGNKISGGINPESPCPNCGFPKALKYSIEYCRELAKKLNKHKGAFIKGFSSCLLNPWVHACENGEKTPTNKRLKKASAAARKGVFYEGAKGYCVLVTIECPGCGEEKNCTDAESILLRII